MNTKTEQLTIMLLNFAYEHDFYNSADFAEMITDTKKDIEKMFTTHDKEYAQKIIEFMSEYGNEKAFSSDDYDKMIADRDAIIDYLKTV